MAVMTGTISRPFSVAALFAGAICLARAQAPAQTDTSLPIDRAWGT